MHRHFKVAPGGQNWQLFRASEWIELRFKPVPVFGAVSPTVLFGDFFSGCLMLFASLFMVFKVSLEIEIQKKGKNETKVQAAKQWKGREVPGGMRTGICIEVTTTLMKT